MKLANNLKTQISQIFTQTLNDYVDIIKDRDNFNGMSHKLTKWFNDYLTSLEEEDIRYSETYTLKKVRVICNRHVPKMLSIIQRNIKLFDAVQDWTILITSDRKSSFGGFFNRDTDNQTYEQSKAINKENDPLKIYYFERLWNNVCDEFFEEFEDTILINIW